MAAGSLDDSVIFAYCIIIPQTRANYTSGGNCRLFKVVEISY